MIRFDACAAPMLPFAIDRSRDPDGSRLRELLRADFHAANLANLRALLVTLLAGGGALLAVLLLAPSLGAPEARKETAAVWVALAVLAVGVAAGEQAWARRRRRLLDELGAAS